MIKIKKKYSRLPRKKPPRYILILFCYMSFNSVLWETTEELHILKFNM